MTYYFDQSFTINITSGKYYDSASGCLKIPYNLSAEAALEGCSLNGGILYKSSRTNATGDMVAIIDDAQINTTIVFDQVMDTDNSSIKVGIGSVSYQVVNGRQYFIVTFEAFYNGTQYSCNNYESYPNGGYTTEMSPMKIVIWIGNNYKSVNYGENVIGQFPLRIDYDNGDYVYLTFEEAETFLTDHNTTVSCHGKSVTYPNQLLADDSFCQDTANQVVYTVMGVSFTQNVAVSYYSNPVLSFDPSETGTPSNRLYVGPSGLTLSKTGFSAKVVYHHNYYSRSSTPPFVWNLITSQNETDVTSSVVWSKDTFSYAFVRDEIPLVLDNGVLVKEKYAIEISYAATSLQTVKSNLYVYLDILEIRDCQALQTDATIYYFKDTHGDEPNLFTSPGFSSFRLTYSDNTTVVDVSSQDISSVVYTLTKVPLDQTPTALSNGDTLPVGTTSIFFLLTTTGGDKAYGSYQMGFTRDYIETISCAPSFEFVLGNKLSKYKGDEIQVTVTWKNGAVAPTTNYLDFTFDYIDYVLADSTLGSSTGIHIGTKAGTIDLSNVTYKKPEISSVVLKNSKGLKASYQNDLNAIDLTETKVTVHYEDAEWTNDSAYSGTIYSDDSHFSVNIIDTATSSILFNDNGATDVDYLNGTNKLDLASTQASYDCVFNFIIKNYFKTGLGSSDVELVYPFKILTLTKISGIRISKAYRDYKVGETFLDKNDDDTTVTLFYEENGIINSSDFLLKEDLPTISVNYSKGTTWTQADSSKRIIVSSVFDSSINAEYTIQVTYDGFVSGSKTNTLIALWQPYIEFEDGSKYTEDNGVLVLYDEYINGVETAPKNQNGIRILANYSAKPKGYIKNIFNTNLLDAQAVMVLLNDYVPPIEGSPNITVEFPSYTGLSENINKCQFGILFGNNNANNRLFVSGNPNVRNADWHSGETNIVHSEGEVQNINGDFSYFPNENVMYYGETDNKVIGYDIVSNDKLLVLKDKSDKEKTVYFRTPTLLTALDSTGTTMTDIQGNTLYQEEFALVKGNNSVAGVSPHSIANLNGDTLFVDSDNTLQGLDLTGIIGDNQRYANTRSAFLDNALKNYDLSKSFLWTNNKYLFMPVENEGLFVTHVKAFNEDSRQYEWWKLQSDNPTCFVEIDNVVYFGNAEGKLYQMRNGKYIDEYKVFVNEGQGILANINDSSNPEIIGGLTIPPESIVVSQDVFNQMFPLDDDGNELKPYYDEEGNQIRHLYFHSVNNTNDYKKSIFYQIGSIIRESENPTNVDLLIKEYDGVYYLEVVAIVNGAFNQERQLKLIKFLKEEKEYYLNEYAENGVGGIKYDGTSVYFSNYGTKYRLVFVPSVGNDRYLMEVYNTGSDQWEALDISVLRKATLCSKVEEDCEVADVDRETFSFRLKDDSGELMNIARFGMQGYGNIFSAEIIERSNVVAYYVTAPFTMGSMDFFKTIWNMTFTNDTGKASEYDLSIASNKIPVINTKTIASISKAKIGTNFNDFTFEAVDFDKDVVPRTYSIQRTMGMQKFVCFAFKNSNNTNAVLSSLSVTYTLPFPSYGSD